MKINHKKAAALSAAVLLTFGVSTQAYAVYAVHDSKVYGQIVSQIKKATEQINQLKEQVNLQMQNLQDLSSEVIDPITNEIAIVTSEYNGAKKGMSSKYYQRRF